MINEKESLEVEKLQNFEEEDYDEDEDEYRNENCVYGDENYVVEEGFEFTQAAADGDIELVKQYIKDGGDIEVIVSDGDNGGMTALTCASKYGYLEIVKYLIEEGADINAKDGNDETALMMASYNGHLEVVKYLIEMDADIDAKDNHSNTALTIASEKGHTEVVKFLENPNEIYLCKKLDIENASDVIKDSCIF